MDTIWASIIAVLGTLLGSGSSYFFQQRVSAQAERFKRVERLRDERIAAFSEFSTALTNYRRTLYIRFNLEREEADENRRDAARWESYTFRSEADRTLVKLRLIVDDLRVLRLAEKALERSYGIRNAIDQEDMTRRRELVHEAHEAFLDAAAEITRQLDSVSRTNSSQ